MTIEFFEQAKQKGFESLFAEFRQLEQAFILQNCPYKVGDYVEVFWESRDYGRESSKAVVRFIGVRHHVHSGFMYYFNKINKTGRESKHPLSLPKYSTIYKINKLWQQ